MIKHAKGHIYRQKKEAVKKTTLLNDIFDVGFKVLVDQDAQSCMSWTRIDHDYCGTGNEERHYIDGFDEGDDENDAFQNGFIKFNPCVSWLGQKLRSTWVSCQSELDQSLLTLKY